MYVIGIFCGNLKYYSEEHSVSNVEDVSMGIEQRSLSLCDPDKHFSGNPSFEASQQIHYPRGGAGRVAWQDPRRTVQAPANRETVSFSSLPNP